MKITTKIMIGINILFVVTVSYIYYAKISENALETNQTEIIISEVLAQTETKKQLDCLSKNIYHEGRSDGITGQSSVAWVTINRVKSEKYPDTICEVVYQAELNEKGIPARDRCQFSWFCDGKTDDINDQISWDLSQKIAEKVFIASYNNETDPTDGATMYHASYVKPYWASSYTKTARIDSHIFYK